LRAEANVWLRLSDQLQAIATKAQGLDMTRMESGIFQLIVTPYDQAIAQIADRCREGTERMKDIAGTLRKVADTYDDEEARNVHRFEKLY